MNQRSTGPVLIGHRGAPGYRPEHTEASYRLAFEQGVDAVEPDIVVSCDGVLVIRHENEISATTDVADHPEFADRRTTKTVDGVKLTGWFTEDFTWAELSTLRCRERVPSLRPKNTRFDGSERMLRLEDLLALVDEANAANQANAANEANGTSGTSEANGTNGTSEANRSRGKEIALVIELKHAHFLREQGHDLVPLLLEVLETCHWSDRAEQLTIECFELAPLERLSEAGLPASYIFLLESEGSPADEVAELGPQAHTFEWYRSDAGLDSLVGRVDGVSVAKRDLVGRDRIGAYDAPADLVRRAHERGLLVFTWTLRPENHYLFPEFRRGSRPEAWGDWESEWRLILSTGVDGVFLDQPDLLARVM